MKKSYSTLVNSVIQSILLPKAGSDTKRDKLYTFSSRVNTLMKQQQQEHQRKCNLWSSRKSHWRMSRALSLRRF